MKHLAVDFDFVQEKGHQGTIRVTHIYGDDQLADALTKSLLKQGFITFIQDWTNLSIVHLVGISHTHGYNRTQLECQVNIYYI